MAFADIAELVQDVGHPESDGGLAGAGIAGETHMQGGRLGDEAHASPHAVDEQERGDFADAGFHRRQADQLLIELT